MTINWYAALGIEERLKVIKAENATIKINESVHTRFNGHKNMYAPYIADFMAEKCRFEFDDKTLTEHDIIKAYSEYEPSELLKITSPNWVKRLEEAYTQFAPSHPNRLNFQDENTTIKAFRSFFEPLFSLYALDLKKDLQNLRGKYGFSLVDSTQIESYFEPAVAKLAKMAERAFVLELRVAKLSGELVGNDSHERFNNFFQHLKQPPIALQFFETYPVLGRMAVAVCNHWHSYFLEIVTHLYQDLDALKNQISPLSKIHTLQAIDALTDSTQTGGRSVAILTFNDRLKVVYKPRDLGIDKAYGQFLQWFNAQNIIPPIEHLAIINRPKHAWCAFVEQNKEMTFEELPVLYTKFGALLCLMYLFDTIDMHRDNSIIVGDNPILIDLETWLQPSLPDDDFSTYRSVRQTHFLPSVNEFMPDAQDLEGTEGMDFSDKTWSEFKELVWENEGIDTMRIVRKRLPLNKNRNSMVIGETVINAADYAPYLVKGFRKTYRHIADNQSPFLETVKHCFQHKKIRVILRDIKKYDALTEDMGHPSNLQNGLTLDQFLDRLWIETEDFPALKTIIGIEKRDLLNLDNAYFYTYSNSTTLFYKDTPLVEHFFEKTALERVVENVNIMSVQDLEKQVRIIRKAFAQMRENALIS